jgi:hypothetical protein
MMKQYGFVLMLATVITIFATQALAAAFGGAFDFAAAQIESAR